MVYAPQLLDQLEALIHDDWQGQVWRYTPAGKDPARENTLGARWNPRGTAAIYTSLTRETVLAEARHRLSLERPRPRFILELHLIKVRLARVLSLEDIDQLQNFGITMSVLQGDDFTPCQYLGGAVDVLECDGLLVPSARHNGSNLVIYPMNMENDGEFEVLESRTLGEL